MSSVTLNTLAGPTNEVEIIIDSDGDLKFELGSDSYFYVESGDLVKALRQLGVIPYNIESESKYPGFFEAIGRFLEDRGYTVSEVLSVEQETETGGYCSTCWYEEIVVRISFKTRDGYEKSHTYYGNMAELIEELTS